MGLNFVIDPELTGALQAEIIDCWTDVSNADGAVGFVPPVSTDDVRPVAEHDFAGAAAGRDRLIVARTAGGGDAAEGRLAALAFIVDGQFGLTQHWRTVKRVMVHPDFQGLGYGVELMTEVARVGREMGLQMLQLECRGDTGNDLFYKKCGYIECGRLPRGLRISETDYRDVISLYLPL